MPLSMHSSAMVRPQILQYIKIATWNKNQCGKFPPDQITENMLCAGKSCSFLCAFLEYNWIGFLGGNEKDACQGDSGGPLGTYTVMSWETIPWKRRLTCTSTCSFTRKTGRMSSRYELTLIGLKKNRCFSFTMLFNKTQKDDLCRSVCVSEG